MNRYSVITEKNPREIVLLRGSGCKWRKCSFCDYHLDFSCDEEENFQLNKKELAKVKGTYGNLETINSGSFCDLDEQTVEEILRICGQRHIKRLHIECHWQDRHSLAEIRQRFAGAGVEVIVKMGVETFDAAFRDDVLLKGMEHAKPREIARFADEVCLLFGLTGQTERSMRGDIETGLAYFRRVCVNLMTENSTPIKPDRQVMTVFEKQIYPQYRDNERVDILLENTDFGVGGE
ncbi:radical SAM protein [Anaerovorax odorimutans]|uniref:Radical SAM protein n=1 Tax=Anaerovorax odorimutans TaxID=109327 RepID=A0ABT1RR18_9FIRM|nr:radical SAM protein [Anaerovorax odorimutans]MCQ4637630.1 radical SAM protein [Anaerovorax odorimutans]